MSGARNSAASPIDVHLIDLASASARLEEIERACPRLSNDDRARAARMTADPEAGTRWRAGRIALRMLLEQEAGPAAVRQVDFARDTGGRPGLANAPPFFSITYSGSLALMAIGAVQAIGIDFELPRSVAIDEPRRTRIVDAGRRVAGLGPLGHHASDDDFLRSWVRLEATAKALGVGIGRMLTMQGVPESRRGGEPGAPGVEVRDLRMEHGFAAVAASSLPAEVTVRPFDIDAVR